MLRGRRVGAALQLVELAGFLSGEQADFDEVEGLMKPSARRNPPARITASRSGTAH